jgi:hypothetical protein
MIRYRRGFPIVARSPWSTRTSDDDKRRHRVSSSSNDGLRNFSTAGRADRDHDSQPADDDRARLDPHHFFNLPQAIGR